MEVGKSANPMICELGYEQSCDYEPCRFLEDECEGHCQKTCQSCAAGCADRCESCKKACTDTGSDCSSRCASERATCKERCPRTLDAVGNVWQWTSDWYAPDTI